MKLAALYSARKSLQNSCTAKLRLFYSILEAKQLLNSSCSGMQKRCAAFEALGSSFAAQLLTFKCCELAAVVAAVVFFVLTSGRPLPVTHSLSFRDNGSVIFCTAATALFIALKGLSTAASNTQNLLLVQPALLPLFCSAS